MRGRSATPEVSRSYGSSTARITDASQVRLELDNGSRSAGVIVRILAMDQTPRIRCTAWLDDLASLVEIESRIPRIKPGGSPYPRFIRKLDL